MMSARDWTDTGRHSGQRNMLYGGTIISYLLGSDFLCLTVGSPLYYRTSINKRRRKELSMNTCEAVHYSNIKTYPCLQRRQYSMSSNTRQIFWT